MSSSIQHLLALSHLIGLRPDTPHVLSQIAYHTRLAMKSEMSTLALYDKITNEIYYQVHWQGNKKSESFIRTNPDHGSLIWCIQHHRLLDIRDPSNDPRFNPENDAPDSKQVRSVLAIPVQGRLSTIGVLRVMNKRTAKAFSRYDEKILTLFAGYAALLLDNERLFEENISRETLSNIGQNILNSAHGLKNLLNNIDGGAYIVERSVQNKSMEGVHEGWDILKRNSQRLRDVVLDMLLYSRPRETDFHLTDINHLCSELIILMKDSAARDHVEMAIEADDRIGKICLDHKAVSRGLMNLLGNAVFACQSKGGGKVLLSTQLVDDETFKIIVKDDGCGIPVENLAHIFDVFFTTKGSKGTGLGLAVSKKIITEHGGTLEVESEVGAGSTFTMTFPRTGRGQWGRPKARNTGELAL